MSLRPAVVRLEKIKYQLLRNIELSELSDKKKVMLVQSIINAQIDGTSIVDDTKMPEEMFGVSLQWSEGEINDSIVGITSDTFSIVQDNTKDNVFIDLGDIRPPSEVRYLSINPTVEGCNISWLNPIDEDFSHVVIEYGIEGFQEFTGTIDNKGTSITGLTSGEIYTIKIKTVDETGNESVGKIHKITPN